MPCDCKHRMNECRITKKLRITKHGTTFETRRQMKYSLVMSCDGQKSAKNMVPDLGGDAKSWRQRLNTNNEARKKRARWN